MAVLPNDSPTSDNPIKVFPLESAALEMLPFVDDDPCGEFGGRQGHMRDLSTINSVAVECWKVLRIPKKTGPRDLSLFPQMPIDILLEVLGHLHPIDLKHVASVNKAFHGLLHSSHGEAVWRSAFVGRAPLPLCPTEISGRRWSKLLFGPRRCDECGARDIAPDYRLWRRLCTDCMNLKLYNGVPSYTSSHEVNTLVVKTFRDDGRTSAAESDVGRLWPAEGTVVAQEYERLKAADAEARLRGDNEPGALAAFIEARKMAVRAIEQRADEAELWSDKVHDDSLELWSRRYGRVVRSARKRLIEEGYDPRDVRNADLDQKMAMAHFDNFPRLTSKRWHKIRPYVLPLIFGARADRLKRERELLITSRTASAAVAVSHVLRTAPPETWAYAPPPYIIEPLPQLQTLIHDPSDAPLADDDPRLADALLGLPEFVEAWRAEKRALLVSLLPLPTSTATSECSSSSNSANAKLDLRRLNLATSVYTCLGSWVGGMTVTAGRALIGWAGAGAHLRCRSLKSYWDRRVHYAAEGAAAAAALVRLVGLDPETATAEDMDGICGGEVPVQHTIERTRIRNGDAAHRDIAPAWALLTDEAAEDVRRRRETTDPVVWDSAWACTLCTAHYEHRTTRATAVEHVQGTHGIPEPEQGLHFMYFAGMERTPRVPGLLSQEGNVLELRCKRCIGGKLRSLRDIRRHVADKHEVEVPSEADWTRVELILRRTPTPGAHADSETETETQVEMDTTI
ncbi:hypothetical protein MVEN_02406700 [Mycena venus]|uniref:F-box domain-containing protein n=1 Tax=Mycena venus TaxID=2733690 RepID=A0A8H6X2S5_9AGAR|nr:hypothetical protein MVEN_02406700 [Mycena venus]